MHTSGKATRIQLFSCSTPQMRAFHVAWMAFFLCFFAWFGVAPLMTIVRDEMHLTKQQIGWCVIGSVAVTMLARIVIGWACDRWGPRLAYSWLLMLGSLPVMGIALATQFETFMVFRILIGAIGASFVVTQYHMSVMFAPNCVGTANAITAGWGNLGGGATQIVMPLLFALFVGVLGFSNAAGWRLAMVVVGSLCFLAGVAYYFLTQDSPTGNYRDLRKTGKLPAPRAAMGTLLEVCRDHRVWALSVIYGACFGIEITINNIAVLYFIDYFAELKQGDSLSAMTTAGLMVGLGGAMNLFARALGGIVADRCGKRWGLAGRVKWLFLTLFGEGLAIMLFSQATSLALAFPALVVFNMFVDMASGATFAVTPFVNKRALGVVAGIVGAGGNAGAVAAGFLFKYEGLDWPTALFLIGAIVTACSFLSFAVTFSAQAHTDMETASAAELIEEHRTIEWAGATS